MILTGFVAYGCYLFVQSPPAAGIAAAVVGVLVVALGYLTWGVCGDCLSRRWYPSAFFAALVSLSISGCVMFVIHQTIVHSSEQPKAALMASEQAQVEASKQLESDRAMYQSLLTPVTPVVSAERAGLQNTIRDFQEQARIKRLKNYDKPADRIDENVVKLQSRLSELMLIDADANARVDRARAEQAASLLDSIKKREAMAVQAPVVVVTTLSERVMLIAAVLIELITSGMMLYLSRLKGVLDAEMASEKVNQVSAFEPSIPATVLTPSPAPKEPTVEAAPVEPGKALDQPECAHVAAQELHEHVHEAELPHTEHSSAAAVEVAPEAAPAMAVLPVVVEHSHPTPVAPAAAPEPNPEPDLMMGLKPHERQRYSTFREHLLQMPPDEAIKTDAVAAALGFGKDLVSTFFKIAGQQSVIQKQGRQWFLYAGN
jgi:hypothetical protein